MQFSVRRNILAAAIQMENLQKQSQTQDSELGRFSAIMEKDVDLLLLEEFWCHPEFACWFYGQIREYSPGPDLLPETVACEARHSVGSGGSEVGNRRAGRSQGQNSWRRTFLSSTSH